MVGFAGESLDSPGGAPYWTKVEIDGPASSRLPRWTKDSLKSFREVILDPKFPCMFARTSEQQGQLFYAFVDTATSDDDIDRIGKTIGCYLRGLEFVPLHEADLQVLIIFIKPILGHSLVAYGEIAQTLLQSLHEKDLMPWPSDIPTDEDDPLWSFAFAGRALFVNISTPANHARRSRNVGPGMTLIASPRDAFDRVAGPDETGRKIRNAIRWRTQTYDQGLAYPPWSTVAYGEGTAGEERNQYILSDDNERPISISIKRCPIR
jgi:FPC/CPF motif-containing protein YcgG